MQYIGMYSCSDIVPPGQIVWGQGVPYNVRRHGACEPPVWNKLYLAWCAASAWNKLYLACACLPPAWNKLYLAWACLPPAWNKLYLAWCVTSAWNIAISCASEPGELVLYHGSESWAARSVSRRINQHDLGRKLNLKQRENYLIFKTLPLDWK